MSKKTREQKIKNTKARETLKETGSSPSTTHHFTFTSAAALKPTPHANTAKSHDVTFAYLRRDIIKTVVLAVVAIGAVVVLSFVLK